MLAGSGVANSCTEEDFVCWWIVRPGTRLVRERPTPKPVMRTVISSSWVNGSSGFDPMFRDAQGRRLTWREGSEVLS